MEHIAHTEVGAMTIVRTTFQVPQLLLHRLKVQAAREQTDVSRLLCKIAEGYLGVHEKEPLMSAKKDQAFLGTMLGQGQPVEPKRADRKVARSSGGAIKIRRAKS
jgi:hypothetical protein